MTLKATILRGGLIAMTVLAVPGCNGGGQPTTTTKEPPSAHAGTKLQWAKSWDSALKRAREENRVVLVDFYADWCIWCKKLDGTTLSDGPVAAFLSEKTVPLRLDVDHEGRELSKRYRVNGLPTVLILNADGSERGRIGGYLPPPQFLERMKVLVGAESTSEGS
jgi:thiol:disulfide interchange protein